MPIITHVLPIGGPGAYVDCSDLGHNRTFILATDRTDRIELEGSGDGDPSRGSFTLTASNSRTVFFRDTSPFMRVSRKEGTGGAIFAWVCGDPASGAADSDNVFAEATPPDAAAGTEFGPAVAYRANGEQTLRDIVLYFAADVVGDETDFARIVLSIVDPSGTPVGVLGSLTTEVNRSQLVAYTVVLDPALLTLPDGNAVVWEIEKQGAGVQLTGVSVVGRLA